MNNKEIAAVVRKGFSLSLGDELTNTTDKDFPLKATNLSRFTVFISDSRYGQTKRLRGNIPQSDFAVIMEQVRALLPVKSHWNLFHGMTVQTEPEIENADNVSDAEAADWDSLSATIRFGKGSGKTVGQFALTLSVDEIKKQIEFLGRNADTYPANKTLMAQFEKAVEFKNKGVACKAPVANAAPKAVSEAPVVTVYEEKIKPLTSTRDESGMSLVYGISILCHFGKNSPWEIRLENTRGEVTKDSFGRMSVGKTADKSFSSIYCDDKEFLSVMTQCESVMDAFNQDMFLKAHQKACELSAAAREQAAQK